MKTMRDRIAKRLYDHWREEDLGHEYVEWDLLPDKATWRDRADAILDELREPDEGMVEAGEGETFDALAMWRTMIDHARQEGASNPNAT
jgi:hypothetical protein